MGAFQLEGLYTRHTSPIKQFCIILRGGMEIEAGDGEKREFKVGSVFLLADVQGKGHRVTKLFDEEGAVEVVFVTLET